MSESHKNHVDNSSNALYSSCQVYRRENVAYVVPNPKSLNRIESTDHDVTSLSATHVAHDCSFPKSCAGPTTLFKSLTVHNPRQAPTEHASSLPDVTDTIPANRTSAPHDTPAFGFGASAQTLMKEKTPGRKACQQSRVHDAHCTCAASNPLDRPLSTVLPEVVWGVAYLLLLMSLDQSQCAQFFYQS